MNNIHGNDSPILIKIEAINATSAYEVISEVTIWKNIKFAIHSNAKPMEIIETEISGLLIIKPQVFEDERGYFFESYNRDKFVNAGIDVNFVQDNESKSMKDVLRGLHFQSPPFAQGKLVRVMRGAVLDVAVDLRKGSSTYGKWASIMLTESNKFMYWIPAGMAHGFLTLEDNTVFFYKCTNIYNKPSEGSIRWDDPTLQIDWGIRNPIISAKDEIAPLFKGFVSPF